MEEISRSRDAINNLITNKNAFKSEDLIVRSEISRLIDRLLGQRSLIRFVGVRLTENGWI